MALSKVNFNSLNLTPTANKTVVFNSNNNGIEAGDVGGSLVLISEQTASSSSTISFTSGIDSTYKQYIFKFINIHAATAGAEFQFQSSTDGGSNYNVATTTTMIQAYHREDGNENALIYSTTHDTAQSTSFVTIAFNNYTEDDNNLSGTFNLFDPSNTTFVKHFLAITNNVHNDSVNLIQNMYMAGYANTTSAINAIQFKMSSGNIDSGTIKLYGVS